MLDPRNDLVLVCDPGHAIEARVRLGRIGFDRVAGALEGDVLAVMEEMPEVIEQQARLTAEQLAEELASDDEPGIAVLDVRNLGELEAGRIGGSLSIPLAELVSRLGEVPQNRPVVVYCASGYRSSIAASVISRHGHRAVSDLVGGYEAWDLLQSGSVA